MEQAVSGVSYNFDNDFKGLPVKNRVKLLKTAKNLLEVQKTSKDNHILSADALLPMEVKIQGLAQQVQ